MELNMQLCIEWTNFNNGKITDEKTYANEVLFLHEWGDAQWIKQSNNVFTSGVIDISAINKIEVKD